ncbi:MAG: Lipocalin-like domain protein [Gemmatimonadetes bacterium]|nr:Lipocalin-like domain protein [Gemmatimonadota bacterium]
MRILTLAFLAFTTLTACRGDDATNPTVAVVGTYTLQQVNGGPLPFTVQTGDPKIEIISEQLTVAAGGSYTVTTMFRHTTGGVASTNPTTDTGTYTISGTTLAFHDSGGDVGSAMIGTNTLTFQEDGVTLLFVK